MATNPRLLEAMSVSVDWKSVTERIKGLVIVADQDEMARAAARLDVDERDLREALRDQSRVSTMKVVAAIVTVYGLDPSWVLTGVYDSSTHRVALRGNRADVDELVRKLVADGVRPHPDADNRASP